MQDTPEFQTAKEFAASQIEHARLFLERCSSEPQILGLSVYPTDDDARECTGEDMSAALHWLAMQSVAFAMAEEDVRVSLVTTRAKEYLAWLDGRPNTDSTRAEYAMTRANP